MQKNILFGGTQIMQNIELSSKRTDIVLESHEINKQQKGEPILYDNTDQSGVEIEHSGDENIKITRVKVVSEEGANAIGKPIGNYITLEIPGLRQYDQELFEESCQELAKEIIQRENYEKTTIGKRAVGSF